VSELRIKGVYSVLGFSTGRLILSLIFSASSVFLRCFLQEIRVEELHPGTVTGIFQLFELKRFIIAGSNF
jgi:hypothetical protein